MKGKHMNSAKIISAAIILSIANHSAPALADDAQAKAYLSQAVSELIAGNYEQTRQSCLNAIATADTEEYRLSAHQMYASTLGITDEDYTGVVAYLEPVIANAAPDATSYAELIFCYRTLADAKKMLGDLSGAIAVRTEAIDMYAQLTIPPAIGPLYAANASDNAKLGNFEASRAWWDRLFAEQWVYGATNETRTHNRIVAVQQSGYERRTQDYRDRIDTLLAEVRLEEDRGNAVLLKEKFFSYKESIEPIETARVVAEELYLLTNIYGWHKPTDEQPKPYFKTDDMTEFVQEAIAVVLLPLALGETPGTTQAEADSNYQYAKFLLAELPNEEQVTRFRSALLQVVRKYELQSGSLGGQ